MTRSHIYYFIISFFTFDFLLCYLLLFTFILLFTFLLTFAFTSTFTVFSFTCTCTFTCSFLFLLLSLLLLLPLLPFTFHFLLCTFHFDFRGLFFFWSFYCTVLYCTVLHCVFFYFENSTTKKGGADQAASREGRGEGQAEVGESQTCKQPVFFDADVHINV